MTCQFLACAQTWRIPLIIPACTTTEFLQAQKNLLSQSSHFLIWGEITETLNKTCPQFDWLLNPAERLRTYSCVSHRSDARWQKNRRDSVIWMIWVSLSLHTKEIMKQKLNIDQCQRQTSCFSAPAQLETRLEWYKCCWMCFVSNAFML